MYDKILVPVDGSDASNHGLDEAARLAKKLGAQLKLIHIVNELLLLGSDQAYFGYNELVEVLRQGGKKIVAASEARARAQGIEPQSTLIESVGARAADVIVQHANEWGAQLIVLGTHGRRGIRRLALGSDAETVARIAPVPVLLVRAAEAKAAHIHA